MWSFVRRLIEADDDSAADYEADLPAVERDLSPLFGGGGDGDDEPERALGYTEMVDLQADDDISLLVHAEQQDDDDAAAEDTEDEDSGHWAFEDDSGAEDQWFSDEEDEDDNGSFAPRYEYQFQKLDDRMYAVRALGRSDSTVIVAREDHPLINYVKRLAEDERIEMRALLAAEPVTFQQLQNDYAGRLPGCLRAFNCNVLLRHARYRLYHASDDDLDDDLDDKYELDGALHISRAYRRPSATSTVIDETPNGLDPGDGYPGASESPLFVLGDLDPDAEKRAATLVDIANGVVDESELERFEMRHNDGNLMTFSSSKPTADETDGAFTDPSPVHPTDPLRWLVVKMHYYVMFKAFTASCARSGALERMIIEAQQRAGPLGYAFGSPPKSSGETYYTPHQEHAVVDRMLEMSIGERAAENAVEARRVAVEQCTRELGDCVPDLMAINLELSNSRNEEMRERVGVLLDLAKRARDAGEQLNEAHKARLDDRFVGKGADKNA